MKTAIITGATGAIGIALIDKLYESGYKVYAVCRENPSRIEILKNQNKAIIIYCDISNLSSLTEFVTEKIDIFFHFAWENTFGAEARNNMYSQINNVKYTIDAVNVAKKLGCHTFIGAGSQAEYGRSNSDLTNTTPTFPENGYGMAKLCAGQMSKIEAEKFGLKHIWTRILSVYGPYDRENTFINSAIKTMLQGKVFSCTKCEQMWDYMYSKDIAMALYLLSKKGRHGFAYPLGSGKKQPLSEYIKIIRDYINPNLKIGFGDILYAEKQVMNLCADISDLQKDTSFMCDYSFEQGIKETIKWIKEEKHE